MNGRTRGARIRERLSIIIAEACFGVLRGRCLAHLSSSVLGAEAQSRFPCVGDRQVQLGLVLRQHMP